MIFCKAQPHLQLQLQLAAELVIVSDDPPSQPYKIIFAVLQFLFKWRLSKLIFVRVNIVQVNIVHVTLLSKWYYCPSDIIVQGTLLSKWHYCPSEYCPSNIFVQENAVCKNDCFEIIYQNIFELLRIFLSISKCQIELKCYTIILMTIKNEFNHTAG